MKRLSNPTPPAWLGGLCLGLAMVILLALVSHAAARHQALQTRAGEALAEQALALGIGPPLQAAFADLSTELAAVRQQLQDLATGTLVLQQSTGTTAYYSSLRKVVQALMRAALAGNPDALGVYAVWQPNAVDEQDEVFVGDTEYGSNGAGRFAVQWRRTAGDALSARVIEELQLTGAGHNSDAGEQRFRCALVTAHSCLVGPYFHAAEGGRMQRALAVTVPLLQAGAAIGVYGLEVDVAALEARLSATNAGLYAGAGQLHLVTEEGVLVTSAQAAGQVSTPDSPPPREQAPDQVADLVINQAGAAVQETLPPAVRDRVLQGGQGLLREPGSGRVWWVMRPVLLAGAPAWAAVYQLPATALPAAGAALEQGALAEARYWQVGLVLWAVLTLAGLLLLRRAWTAVRSAG
ncbi:MAG TPA: hypothetical protein VL027_12695 [Spongiibacteraceae bacterium]|jgi:hypothetical protein|nr:hypothetical protein [Spongiibacteraceae bacterium]HUH38793.1 hypothetical protein [Spongiibacteraceae bacterium]